MRLPKVQSILLLLSPILLIAIFEFAKCGERFLYPVSVSSDGNTLVYWSSQADPSIGVRLFRDEGGVISSIAFPSSGLHGFGRVVATPKWIVVFMGNKVYFVDPMDFSNVKERSYFDESGLVTGLVLSSNQRYLFYSANLKRSNAYHSGIIDLSSLDLTWQNDSLLTTSSKAYGAADNSLESQGETVSLGSLLDVYSKDSADAITVEAFEFENGEPRKFELGPGPLKLASGTPSTAPYWSRDRSTSVVTIGGQTIANNIQSGETRLLGPTSDGIYVVAQAENKVLLNRRYSTGDLILLDLPSLKIEQTIPYVDSSGGSLPAISTDGQTIAREVMFNNLTWAEYLRSGCEYYRQHIEILDAKTGQRIRICENSRGFWLYAILAFGGTIAWTVVWLRSSWNCNDSSKLISDIAVIGLLWLSFFLLRYVFGGPISGSSGSGDSARPAEIGFMCLMTSLTALISIWSISSRLRVSFRIPVGVIAIAALWALPLALWRIYELDSDGIRFECLFVAIGVSLCCFIARMFGWAIAKPESAGQIQPAGRTKIKLSDMFLWPVAIVALITIFPPLMKDIGQNVLLFQGVIGLGISVITMSAFWAALSRYNLLKWFFGTLFLIALIASLSRFYFWHEDAYIIKMTRTTGAENFQFFIWRLVALSAGVGLCSLLMMCWVRRQGWRWSKVNQRRVREVVSS